jgi:hypothetical protein
MGDCSTATPYDFSLRARFSGFSEISSGELDNIAMPSEKNDAFDNKKLSRYHYCLRS